MNVKQLKAILNKYPDYLKVVVDGYEDGYDGPNIQESTYTSLKKESWWEGKYQSSWDNTIKLKKVLLIGR